MLRDTIGLSLSWAHVIRPGQSEAANCGRIPIRILGPRAETTAAIRPYQFKARNMVSEGAGNLVILAMNIVGDGTTKRHILRSRSYREKEAAWHREIKDLGERNTGFGGENPSLRVKIDQAIHPCGLQQRAFIQQADIPVATAQSNRQSRLMPLAENAGEITLPTKWNNFSVVLGIAPPRPQTAAALPKIPHWKGKQSLAARIQLSKTYS